MKIKSCGPGCNCNKTKKPVLEKGGCTPKKKKKIKKNKNGGYLMVDIPKYRRGTGKNGVVYVPDDGSTPLSYNDTVPPYNYNLKEFKNNSAIGYYETIQYPDQVPVSADGKKHPVKIKGATVKRTVTLPKFNPKQPIVQQPDTLLKILYPGFDKEGYLVPKDSPAFNLINKTIDRYKK